MADFPLHILPALVRAKGKIELSLSGTSMLPVLSCGQTITVCAKEQYEIGDILVFLYKNGEVLTHRLLKIQNGRYFCKGDNSFRLEDIEKKDIIGAVELEFDKNNTPEFISASYAVNRLFRANGYDRDKTVKTQQYIEYEDKFLR